MALKLEDRPEEIYDDKPSWRTNVHGDADDLNQLESDFNAPSATDDDLPDGHPDKGSKSDSPKELRNQEDEAEVAGESDDEADSQAKEDSFYKDKGRKPKASIRARLTSRKAAVGMLAASAVVSGMTAISLQAPNLILNNLKELLVSRIGNVQVFQTRKYRQSQMSKLKNVFTSKGRLGQTIIKEMEADGYQFKFDPNDRSKIIGLVHPRGDGIIGDGIGDHVAAYTEHKHPWRSSRWKTKISNAFYEKFGVSRSSVVDEALAKPSADGKEVDPERVVNKEVAKDVLDGEETKVVGAKSDEKDSDKQAKADAARDEADNQSSEIADTLEKDKQEILENGTPLDELEDGGLAKLTTEAGESATPDLVHFIEDAATKEALSSKLWGKFQEWANPLNVVNAVCTVRQQGIAAEKLGRRVREIKLVRNAFVFINAADETRRGKAAAKLVSELGKRITSEDKNGMPIGGSPGFGFMLKNKFSKSKNTAIRSSVAVDGKLTGPIGGLNDKLKGITILDTSCPYTQNPLVQVGAGVAQFAVAIITDGASEGVQLAFEEGVTQGLKAVFEEIVSEVTIKSVVKDLALQAIGQLSFAGIMMLVNIYVQKQFKLPYSGQEKGGQLGDMLVAGMGSANKQRSLLSGMVPATTTEFAIAQKEYIAWHNEEIKKMSFTDRIFNMDNSDSLAFNLTASLAYNGTSVRGTAEKPIQMAANMLNPSKTLASALNVFGSSALADDGDEIPFETFSVDIGENAGTQLATDPAGNPQVILRPDIEAIDGESNKDLLIASGDIDATTLQPKSDAFKEHMEECVEAADIYTSIETNKGDCLAKKPKTKMFKAHLAYLDMMDSLNSEFLPDTINESSTSGSTTTDTSTGPANQVGAGGLAWPLKQTKADVQKNLGKCLNEASKTICQAGHPYIAFDLFAAQGTQVVAAHKGKVIKAGVGNCGHGFNSAFTVQVYDESADITYFYQHMDPNAKGVTTGTVVNPGDPIGKVGPSSAACGTSPHLHFDASRGKGRKPCSRTGGCPAATKALFINISGDLYGGYSTLQ